MNERYNGSEVLTRYELSVEERKVTAYVFRGRMCWIAIEVGRFLDYGDEGRTLPTVVRGPLSEELIEGKDFAVLTGEELKEFKELTGLTNSKLVSRTPALMVLYETGLDLVCLRTDKPLGKKLRRMVAEEVLPKLRRGEAIVPAGAVAAPDDTRRMEVGARFLESVRATLAMFSPAVCQEAKDAVLANAMAMATTTRLAPLLPELPAGRWKRPTEIGKELGVHANTVGRAITALGLKGDKEHSRTIMDKKAHGDGQVEAFLYDEWAVEQIRAYLVEKGKVAA